MRPVPSSANDPSVRSGAATTAVDVTRTGATLGVEEEYHLLEPDTLRLANRPALAARALTGAAGPHVQPEMLNSQLEAATGVCADLPEVRSALLAIRREAAGAAAAHDAVILATSTHPSALLTGIEVMACDRYERLVERFGSVVAQLNLCGCHVHVSVPDLETAVAVSTAARPYLPLLIALTASSPFHEARDTRYDSYRVAGLGVWPQGGLPPHLRSAEHYRQIGEELCRIGLVEDLSGLLWDVRPSTKYPTVEFRIGDMCTDVDDAVLYAGLVRSLTRVLAARARTEPVIHEVPDVVVRAARWRAARHGLSDTLWNPSTRELVPAVTAVRALLAELHADLEDHGEYELVDHLLSRLLTRGNAASRQRARYAETGDLHAVIAAAVELTAAG